MNSIPKKKLIFKPENHYGVPEITPEQLMPHVNETILIDVRRYEELSGELGHIEGIKWIEMGPKLEAYLQSEDRELEIVFVCRSGNRSGNVTQYAQQLGFKNSINLQGGMIRWNELNYKVSKHLNGNR